MKSILQLVLVLLLFPTTTHADIYVDGTFNMSDWVLTTFNTGNGETASASQENEGAPQDEFRRMTHTTTNGTNSLIHGRHIRSGWEYNPAVSGRIDSIFVEYKYQKPTTDPYHFGLGFLLEQNGDLFYDSTHYQGLPPSHTSWTSYDFTALQSDFNVLGGTGGILDFSNTAAPIHFGLFTANSFDPSHPSGFTSSYNVDDFMINVSSSVPEPSMTTACVLGLAVGMLRRRRKIM